MSDFTKIWLLSKFIHWDAERREIEKEKRHLLYLKQLQDEERGVHHVVEKPTANDITNSLFMVLEAIVGAFIGVSSRMNHWESAGAWIILGVCCVGGIWCLIIKANTKEKNSEYDFCLPVFGTILMVVLNLIVLGME